jgi:hypothetical protein
MKDRNEALRAIPLFRDMPEKDLADIAGLLIDRKFPRDAVVYEDGSLGDYMYIISEGQVKITKMSEDGREKILEILGPGNFHGEMALLARSACAASAKTHRRGCAPPERRLHGAAEAEPRGDPRADPVRPAPLARDGRADQGPPVRAVRAAPGARWRGWPRSRSRGGRTGSPRPPSRTSNSPTWSAPAASITRVVKELKDEGWLEQEGKRYLVPSADVEG